MGAVKTAIVAGAVKTAVVGGAVKTIVRWKSVAGRNGRTQMSDRPTEHGSPVPWIGNRLAHTRAP